MHYARVLRHVAIVLVLFCSTACTFSLVNTPVELACEQTPLSGRAIDGLYVLPEDSRKPIVEEIDAARCAIDVTIYLISDDQVIDALARAQARGVTVRVLLEETPFGGFGQVDTADLLRARGIEVKPGRDEFTFTHAKYLILDHAVGIVTNQNLTFSSFESNREFGVVTTDPDVVDSLAALFESDWTRTNPPAVAQRLIVSPINARESLVSLLRSADKSISLYVEVIRDDAIVAELEQAADRGVEVRIITNPPDDELDVTVLTELLNVGVRIRVAEPWYIHAKALLIDGDIAVIGSHNPTSTSIDENREVSLLVSDPVALERLSTVFEYDWMVGSIWAAEHVSTDTVFQNHIHLGLALDMPMVYGYCVRTVPMGLAQISQ